MKLSLCTLSLLLTINIGIFAQSKVQDSLAAKTETREYAVASIQIDGEVESPGIVDLTTLPLRSVRIKELAVDDSGRQHFKGAFLYTGYSLHDILNTVKVKKSNEKEFGPSTDLYVIVENENGQRAVFSWGEIFYARDTFRELISSSVQAINPSKLKATWPLPTQPRLVAADDFNNSRFVTNPSRIIVKSFAGSFSSVKPKDLFSPQIELIEGTHRFRLGEIEHPIAVRSYASVSYGHGMGYKGVQTVAGYVLKDLLKSVGFDLKDFRESIAVVSAKDGYRAVFSASEIFNRNDNQDFILMDQKESKKDGRYSLYAAPDFFVDRNVKAIEKIEIVQSDSHR